MENNITIENSQASITISNIKCTDECPNDPKLHVSFDVSYKSFNFYFKVNFSEMVYYQFDFKEKENIIIDECWQEKRLIIGRDEICLKVSESPNKEWTTAEIFFSLKVDPEKIENFKIELKAYINLILEK